jgi:hypothetical protein
MRKLITLMLSAGLVVGTLATANAGAPKTVWEDATGDADNAQGLGASIPGGFDLVTGAIAKNKANLEFTVTHADMPPSGSLPEGFRFLWAFSVGDEMFRLTVKSGDIGKPDAGQEQTTERVGRVDTAGHFRLEGECGSNPLPAALTFINCAPLAYLEGTWNPGEKSFTFPVPMKLLKAKTGSIIGPGGGDAAGICQICWVSHVAERSHSDTIIDTAAMAITYKVPKK